MFCLCFFEKFWHSHRGQTHSTLDVVLFIRESNEQMVTIFWFRMMMTCTLHLEQNWSAKRVQNYQKIIFLPLFLPWSLCVWVVLVDFIFGGENRSHFENQGKFWKLDRIIFPMTYPGLDLDIRKAVKSQLEEVTARLTLALRVWYSSAIFTVSLQVDFYLWEFQVLLM